MKKILFVANMKKDKDLFYSKRILLNIVEKKVKVFVDTTELIFSDKIELVSKKTLKEIDLMLVLGGDGTVLTNARKYEKYDIPIVCINLGRVGALAVAELDDYETYIDKYLNDDYISEEEEIDRSKPKFKAVITPEEYRNSRNGILIDSNGQYIRDVNGTLVRVDYVYDVIINEETNEKTKLEIVIQEGKNREIRRMFESIGKNVVFLKRTQIGLLRLGGLPRGTTKPFDPKYALM
jgi:hypothetical protein